VGARVGCAGVVKRHHRVGHALLHRHRHIPAGARLAGLPGRGGDGEALGDVALHCVHVVLQRLRLGGGVRSVEGCGAVPEQLIHLLHVGRRNHQQVVFELQFCGDAAGFVRCQIGVDDRGKAMGDRRLRSERRQDGRQQHE